MPDARHGEWYWGAKCPICGAMSAHTHDPTRGKADHGIEETHVEVECPNGHRFSVRAENLLSFEWGAQ